MAETQKPNYLEDIARYQSFNVTARLGSSEETAPFMQGSLEKAVSGMNVNPEFLPFVKGTMATEEGMKIAIQAYNGKYQEALNQLSIPEFYGLRFPVLKGILGAEKAEEAKAIMAKYEGKTIGKIMKEYTQAQAILKDKTGLFDPERRKAAEGIVKKFSPIYSIVTTLEDRTFDELRNAATKSHYKEIISEALKAA